MATMVNDTVIGAESEEVTPRQRSMVRKIVGNYLLRRLIRAFVIIFLVSTLTFFLVRLLPGSPVEVYVFQQMNQYGYTQEEAENQARSLFSIDVSQPMVLQYLDYMGNLAQGDLGLSLVAPGTTVASIIQSRIWWTVFCVGTALLISFVAGALIGMLMAFWRGGRFDGVMSTFAAITSSVPDYQLALLTIVILGVRLAWVPYTEMRGAISSGQEVELSLAFVQDALFHAALPIAVYVFVNIGNWMLLMKSSTISALEEDFVTAARARGIPEWRILIFYVGRNAILPLFTTLTVSIGFVVGGSLLVEPIFQYQGIGSRLFDALNRRDYSTLQGIFLIITVAVVMFNLLADLLYSRLDPRIRSTGED